MPKPHEYRKAPGGKTKPPARSRAAARPADPADSSGGSRDNLGVPEESRREEGRPAGFTRARGEGRAPSERFASRPPRSSAAAEERVRRPARPAEAEEEMNPEEFLAGKHSILEALRSGRPINKIWVSETAQKHQVQPILTAAKEQGLVVQTVDRRKLDQMVADLPHQGIVAQVAAHAYAELEDLIASAKASDRPPFFLILDEIEDPHNLGSILRTADSTGVHGVIIPKRRSVGLTATVSKTSAGAVEYVPVARVTNIVQAIDQLKGEGIWVGGADVKAPGDVYRAANFRIPLALVIGNESKGIGRLIKDKCDFLVRLPMAGRINSLNASVAAGVLMYEVVRQRGAVPE